MFIVHLRLVQYVNYNDSAKTSLIDASHFYNPCFVLKGQIVLVVTLGPGMARNYPTAFCPS